MKEKTETEWRESLTPEQYSICRCSETEPPFDNEYWDCHENGDYHCVCCDLKLFSSEHKFDSGTGWPSFYDTVSDKVVSEKRDESYGRIRVEVVCSKCESHLGHLFEDGPSSTGLRYCINSASIKLFKN